MRNHERTASSGSNSQSSTQSRRKFLRALTAVAGVAAVAALTTKNAKAGYSREAWCPPEKDPGPPCFLRGTTIRTDAGEVAVEALSIGDRVITRSGEARAIKWIGQRKYRLEAGKTWPAQIMPIRVAKSALAENVPSVDLYLSPLHALYIDGVLIPVKHLVNGTTIRPAMPEGVADVEYFHVELETHDVIFAADAPAETYRQIADAKTLVDNRESFSNFAQYYRLYGREVSSTRACAPYMHYRGRRDLAKARVRLEVSRLVDVRDPIQRAHDRLADRAALVAI